MDVMARILVLYPLLFQRDPEVPKDVTYGQTALV
jgi:hypothetical protein